MFWEKRRIKAQRVNKTVRTAKGWKYVGHTHLPFWAFLYSNDCKNAVLNMKAALCSHSLTFPAMSSPESDLRDEEADPRHQNHSRGGGRVSEGGQRDGMGREDHHPSSSSVLSGWLWAHKDWLLCEGKTSHVMLCTQCLDAITCWNNWRKPVYIWQLSFYFVF